jgi:hypothetical protein
MVRKDEKSGRAKEYTQLLFTAFLPLPPQAVGVLGIFIQLS